MIFAQETFNDTWPFKPNFFSGNGFKMHYVDEGKGTPIICLHGEPTWGYIYRKFIPPLSRNNRVIVPDHMGFGKSETPQYHEYTLKTHVDNLAGLIEKLELILLPEPKIFFSSIPKLKPEPVSALKVPANKMLPVFISSSISVIFKLK